MADAERFADEDPDRSGPDPVAEHDALVALMPDTHLPPRERDLLGARSNGYASPTVVRLFRALQARGGFHGMGKPAPLRRFEAGRAFDALEVQIQSELRRYAPWKERPGDPSTPTGIIMRADVPSCR